MVNFTSTLLQAQRFFQIHPGCVSLILLFNVNVDSLSSSSSSSSSAGDDDDDDISELLLPEECRPAAIAEQMESLVMSLDATKRLAILDQVQSL